MPHDIHLARRIRGEKNLFINTRRDTNINLNNPTDVLNQNIQNYNTL